MTRGGFRPGAGRKPTISDKPSKPVFVRLSEEQLAIALALSTDGRPASGIRRALEMASQSARR